MADGRERGDVLGLTAAGWVSLALGILIAIAFGVLAMRE